MCRKLLQISSIQKPFHRWIGFYRMKIQWDHPLMNNFQRTALRLNYIYFIICLQVVLLISFIYRFCKTNFTFTHFQNITLSKSKVYLTLSWRRPLSYRNQSFDLLCKSIDWFLYDNGLRHERVKYFQGIKFFIS